MNNFCCENIMILLKTLIRFCKKYLQTKLPLLLLLFQGFFPKGVGSGRPKSKTAQVQDGGGSICYKHHTQWPAGSDEQAYSTQHTKS